MLNLERYDILGFLVSARINEPQVLHLKHIFSVLAEMLAEMVLEDEKFLFERILCLHTVLMLDGFLPHAHKLPSFEFLEEWKLLDMVIGVSFDEPLTKRQELYRGIIFIECKALSGESIVLLLISSLVGCHKEIVRVLVRIWVQVNEHSLFFALAVKKKLNVLV